MPFVVAWHFPNLHREGRRVGNAYARRFAGVVEVARTCSGNSRGWRARRGCGATAITIRRCPGGCWTGCTRRSANLADHHLPVVGERPVLGLGRLRLLPRHLRPRLELRPHHGPAVPRTRTQRPRAPGLRGRASVCIRTARSASAAKPGSCGRVTRKAATSSRRYREHQCSAGRRLPQTQLAELQAPSSSSFAQDGNADGLIEGQQHQTYDENYFGANTLRRARCISARCGRPRRWRARSATTAFARKCRDSLRARAAKLSVTSGSSTVSTSSRTWTSPSIQTDSPAKMPMLPASEYRL